MATRKKKNNIGAFGHPIYGKGFAKYGEMRPNGSSETPNDLEEAADEYAEKHGFRVPYDGSDNFYDDVDVKASKEGFIAGYNLCKEQMMKEAVEYEVWDFSSSLEAYPHVNIPLDNKQYRNGDKVRVIVLPKED